MKSFLRKTSSKRIENNLNPVAGLIRNRLIKKKFRIFKLQSGFFILVLISTLFLNERLCFSNVKCLHD